MHPASRFPLAIAGLLIGLGLLQPGAGVAATWSLANGDRVSGQQIRETADTIVIWHDALGEISIPRTALAVPPPIMTDSDLQAAARIAPANPTQRPTRAAWRRQIEFGYSQQSGVSLVRNLSSRVEITGKDGPDSYRITAKLLQSELAGTRQTDRLDADLLWRHDLTQRIFIQSLSTGFRDGIRNIKLSAEEQAGVGLRLAENSKQAAHVGFAVSGRFQEHGDAPNSQGILGMMFEDYSRSWGNGLHFSQELSAALSSETVTTFPIDPGVSSHGPLGSGNYRLRFNSALVSRAVNRSTLSLRYEYLYDQSVLNPAYRTDQRITTAIGYGW
jgi:putative salt-induced outer membrane protein YdiY